MEHSRYHIYYRNVFCGSTDNAETAVNELSKTVDSHCYDSKYGFVFRTIAELDSQFEEMRKKNGHS